MSNTPSRRHVVRPCAEATGTYRTMCQCKKTLRLARGTRFPFCHGCGCAVTWELLVREEQLTTGR